MGGPSGSSGVPSNSSGQAVAYQPTAQPQSDALYQALLGGFAGSLSPQLGAAFNSAFGTPATSNPFSSTPGAQAYGAANPWTFGTGSITDTSNPNYLEALVGANAAAGGAASVLGNAGTLSNAIGPAYTDASNTASSLYGNLAPWLSAASTPSIMSALNTAQNLGNLGTNVSAYNNQFTPSNALSAQYQSQDLGNGLTTLANITNAITPGLTGQGQINSLGLSNAGNNILNTAFDPQQALFNQQQNLLTQQAAAANAAAGLGGSAYGASNTANALGNFDINWQNQQLAREQAGLSSAQGAYSTAGQLPYIPLQAAQGINSGVSSALSNTNLLPYQTLNASTTLGNELASLSNTANALAPNVANAYTQSGGALGQLQYQPISSAESAASGLGSLYNTGASLTGLPYNTQSTGTNNALSALTNTTNLGNQQYTIPQQLANDLQSYLQLGQAASGLSGQLGALGQSELGSSLSGIGSALGTGSNLLFGNQGLSGALGLGSSGLLGSLGGGGAAAGLGGLTAGTGALDVGGGGELASGLASSAVGAADAGGAAGGFSLGSLLPFGAAS